MSTGNIILTVCEVLISVLLVYGYLNENKIIRWERRQVKKIKKFIYNLIVKLEG